MGKNAKYKKIKKLAAGLPPIKFKAIKGEIVSGKELIDKGVNEVEKKPVDPKSDYRNKTIITQPLNHQKKIKTMFNLLGGKGVAHYMQSVRNYVKSKKTA